MRKDKLYFLTFISISVIFLIIASLGIGYFTKVSVNQLLEVQLEASQREANAIAKLINYEFKSGLDKKSITANVQSTLTNTHTGTSFISVFDWSGKIICHPDITKVNQDINPNQQVLNALKDGRNINELYNLLMRLKNDTSNDISKIESEIIYTSTVNASDLIVAAHANLNKIIVQIVKLRRRFYTILILMGVSIIIMSFFAVRMIGSYYERQLEQKNSSLESELINLSKLNADLVTYQQKITKTKAENPKKETLSDPNKKRLLTHIRNELVPINMSEIAYIHTENTITYVLSFNGNRSTTNLSLDDLMSTLDTSLFFRANRQFIISITSIHKIIKYGNSQLKILVRDADVEIIISKNKAAEFKQWLNI
jgi:DNA-binding LytR/AlgR family response regulator